MADHITFQLVGLRETILSIDQFHEDVIRDARGELGAEIEGTTNYLQTIAPFKKGKLRSTIKGTVEEVGVSGRIRVGARHAHLVEWGHQGPQPAPPHPWFVPEVIRARRRFLDRVRRVLAKPVPALGPGIVEVRET